MKDKPSVDVIIPNYNKSNYIEEAINSVINQTYKNWFLYIIDDNSTDDSLEKIKKYSDLQSEKKTFLIKYMKDFNQNLINRNEEIKMFLSEYENFVYQIIKSKTLKNEKKLANSKNKEKIEIFKDFIELQNTKNIIFSKSSFKNNYKID